MRSMSLVVDLIDLVTKHKSGELRCPATALIYIKVVQVMVKKKDQHQKPGWGSVRTALDRLPPTPVPISFCFSDTENKFIGLIL